MRSLYLALLTAAALCTQVQHTHAQTPENTELERAQAAHRLLKSTPFGTALFSAFFPHAVKQAEREPLPDFLFPDYARYIEAQTQNHRDHSQHLTTRYFGKTAEPLNNPRSCETLRYNYFDLGDREIEIDTYERRYRFASRDIRASLPHSFRSLAERFDTDTLLRNMRDLWINKCSQATTPAGYPHTPG